jgi:mRNA-degrading endonuclease RelE of RelBE toxin-antitoxin system
VHQTVSTIFLAPPAEQQLYTFAKPLRTLLVKRLHALHSSPCPPGVMKLDGLDHLYRIREGDLRIVYTIRAQDLLVLSIKSGPRMDCRIGS